MDFKKLSEIIIHYSKHRVRFGDLSIYKKVLEYTDDTEQADKFMLSEYGGYDLPKLNWIKKRRIYEATRIRN